MNHDDLQRTRDWWLSCLKDPAKLATWLQKLQLTEVAGYHDWTDDIAPTYSEEMSERTYTILMNIANDELKHSKLLVDLMADRDIELASRFHKGMQSMYWTEMYEKIDSLSTACAVNYYGEALAATRFEILAEMKETPSDIKEFLRIALPDEQFHRETLKRLAGEAALEQIKETHERVKNALLYRPKLV